MFQLGNRFFQFSSIEFEFKLEIKLSEWRKEKESEPKRKSSRLEASKQNKEGQKRDSRRMSSPKKYFWSVYFSLKLFLDWSNSHEKHSKISDKKYQQKYRGSGNESIVKTTWYILSLFSEICALEFIFLLMT